MKKTKKYLLIPAMPTPNGRLHLGHIGGPFLKMDILARLLQCRGAIAKVMSASDIYESYVLLKSHQLNRSPYEVSNHFHNLMKEDLKALMIDCEYINPFDEAYKTQVDNTYRNTIKELCEQGATHNRKEKVFYSKRTDRYIAGAWIQGDCLYCKNPTGSYLCEACGMQYNPEDILNVKSTLGENDIEDCEVNTLFLRVKRRKELLDHMAHMGSRKEFVEIVNKYLKTYNGEIRLTNPGNWGVQWGEEKLEGSNYHVIFPYTGLFSLSRVCGHIYAKNQKLDKNPFDKDSDVITMASFGIDSTVPWFVGVLGSMIESDKFKPFDYLLTNHFYRLEGRKFSTSRLHVIWAGDIIKKTKATSDAVRFYLIKNHPEQCETNFDVREFIRFNNNFLLKEVDAYIQILRQPLFSEYSIKDIPRELIEALMNALDKQKSFLMPPNQKLTEASQFMQSWFGTLQEEWKQYPYWSLKAISMFYYPVMPEMSIAIWKECGHKDKPVFDQFLEKRTINKKFRQEHFFEFLKYSELSPCLPKTITDSTLKLSKI
ncbi:class I tRNA ligase family protein [Aquimarina sediminis]|uniref:class I tRNA ligase family protein n=1 Tax=Aquimarina sediminis TaxID=2070536 RepID=UPI000CA07869|nr:class I tRNA ligase family protein [Aquimarina sediminis]